MNFKRPVYSTLKQRLEEQRRLIEVITGPRQVGKTTLINQILKSLPTHQHYALADDVKMQGMAWIETQWEVARQKTRLATTILVLDEVQKIPGWSSIIKKLWDEDTRNNIPLKVVLLGSSPWLMQKGLSESMAGRFETIPLPHWTFKEMHDEERWAKYIND